MRPCERDAGRAQTWRARSGRAGPRTAARGAPALFLLGLAACVRPGERPADWAAEVASTGGRVSLAERRHSALVAASVGDLIRVGGRLETAESSRAALKLRAGGRIEVDPLSVVEFLPQTSSADRVTLELAQGQIQGTAAPLEAATLQLRVGGREITLSRAAQATISAPGAGTPARLEVLFGEALVQEREGGAARVVAGNALELTLPLTPRPLPTPRPTRVADTPPQADAGKGSADGGVEPDAADSPSASGTDDALAPGALVVRSVGRGGALLRLDERGPFTTLRGTSPRAITVGSALRLNGAAQVLIGRRLGPATLVAGPGLFVVRRDPTPGGSGFRLESVTGSLTLSASAGGRAAGSSGPLAIVVQGVTVTPRATFRDSAIAVQQNDRSATLRVVRGEAGLAAKDGTRRTIETGEAVLLTAGTIGPTELPAAAALRVSEPGDTRVFVTGKTLPVSLTWPAAAGQRMVVELSRFSGFARPVFADALRRSQLTLRLERGPRATTYHWRRRPQSSTGRLGAPTAGRLTLVADTSYRTLEKLRPPRNVIREDYGNTTVFYQNSLPRFVFTWAPIAGANSYTVKIMRESDVGTVLVNERTTEPSLELTAGRLAEGSYLWYVAGRAGEALVRTSEHRRLRVAYDNATPDLQIVFPPNGAVVSDAALDVRGVTVPGSVVEVNGKPVVLDESSRFQHRLTLVPGSNEIVFRVSGKQRGSSLYVRTVVRR